MMSSRLGLVALLVVVSTVLPGCDNFTEHAHEGTWQEVGTAEPPNLREAGDFTVTTSSPGKGDAVRAADLVYVRVRTGPASRPQDLNAWLWTGREPVGDSVYPGLLELGPPRLRALLIGMRVGARFSVRAENPPCCNSLEIPIFGFAPRDARHELSRFSSYDWPAAPLGSQQMKIEILNTCRARLFERQATLDQWGYVLNVFDMHYAVSRRGLLFWGALQADCPAAGKPMRLEIGPLKDITEGGLLDWDGSYARASRARHPGWGTALIVFAGAFLTGRFVRRKKSAS